MNSQFIQTLESQNIEIFGCRLCEAPIKGEPLDHLKSSKHYKTLEELQLIEEEEDLDYQYGIVKLVTIPGDISEELQRDKEESIKMKFRKIKQQMIQKSVSHEVAQKQKDVFHTTNKK